MRFRLDVVNLSLQIFGFGGHVFQEIVFAFHELLNLFDFLSNCLVPFCFTLELDLTSLFGTKT